MTWPQKLMVAGGLAIVAGLGLTYLGTDSPNDSSSSHPVPTDSPAADEPAEPPVATEMPLSAADDAKQHDKGWVLESYAPRADGYGGVTTIARVKNVHLTAQAGVFTLTLLRGETVVASFQGSARGVSPGQVVTVEMVTDSTAAEILAGGTHADVEFQTDTTYDS